jgi:hypothetical protein
MGVKFANRDVQYNVMHVLVNAAIRKTQDHLIGEYGCSRVLARKLLAASLLTADVRDSIKIYCDAIILVRRTGRKKGDKLCRRITK